MLKIYQHIATKKWFDFAAASPLIVFYVFAIAGMMIHARPDFESLLKHFDGAQALSVLSALATAMFLVVQIVLFTIRITPLGRASGLLPRAAAVFGANLQVAFLLLPHADYGAAVRMISLLLVIAGTFGSVYVAIWLGRSFSVLPQARSLRLSGPYRFVRHPLYLAEQIATLGVMLQFAAPWSIIIAAASFAVQFPRMHFEEQVLAATFPEYRDYSGRTARLIPRVY
jgi:protein-S-isoprenylcysteine O-methyltransferase Ste14